MLRKALFLFILAASLLFGGCGVSKNIVNCDFVNTSLGQAEQKEYQEKITKFVNELCKYNNDISEITIYIGDTVTTAYREDIMYINTADLDKIDTFFKLLYGLSGLKVNAGEAYGLTVQMCEKAKIRMERDCYTQKELKEFFLDTEQLYLLDFTLPMMESNYFDEEVTAYVRDAANAFVKYCIDEYGKEETYQICTDESVEGQEKLAKLKNSWLADIGVEEVYVECAKLPFEYNDIEAQNYPYVIKEESANWFFASADVREVGYQEFVEEYVEVAPAAEIDFAEARALLKAYIPENIEPVDIFTNMTEKQEGEGLCVHNRAENKIGIYTNWAGLKQCLLHEYIHYLTVGDNKLFENSLGLVEGVTDALACLTCKNQLKELYFADALSHVAYGDESYAFVKEIGALEPNMVVVDGEVYYYYDAKAYYELEPQTHEYFAILWEETVKPEVMSLGALSYSEAGSLSKYLMEQYGLDKVFAHCKSAPDIEELTGLPFAQLYDEWGMWNEQRYQELKNEY